MSVNKLIGLVFESPDPGIFQGSSVKVRSSIVTNLEGQEINDFTGLIDLSNRRVVRLRGKTSRAVLKGTGITIEEPNPYSDKVRPGTKGLFRGGKVSQIQLFSDAIIEVSSSDINQLAKTGRDRKSIRKKKRRGGNPDRFFMWRKIVVHEDVSRAEYRGKKKRAAQTLLQQAMAKAISNIGLGSAVRSVGKVESALAGIIAGSRSSSGGTTSGRRQKNTKIIPIEESIRPPWFSPLYSNLFIGDNIYEKFFGTGSIVDQSLFVTPEGEGGGEAFFSSSAERQEILAKIREADGDAASIANILSDPKNQAKTLSEIPSIEASVDALAFIYGEVRRRGLDVQRFVADYTSRPIATMKDILGTLDLEYRASKNGQSLEVVSGKGGFHSTAVAPFGDLLGLLDNPDLEVARLHTRGKKSPISKSLDPRPGRREMVEAYSEAIGGSRGSLGVGLVG